MVDIYSSMDNRYLIPIYSHWYYSCISLYYRSWHWFFGCYNI